VRTIDPAGFYAGLISGTGMRRRRPQLAQAPEILGNSHISAGISGATIKSVRTTYLIAGLIVASKKLNSPNANRQKRKIGPKVAYTLHTLSLYKCLVNVTCAVAMQVISLATT